MVKLYTPEEAAKLLAIAKNHLAQVVETLDELNALKNCTDFKQDQELTVMYRHATGIRYSIQRLEQSSSRKKVRKGWLNYYIPPTEQES